MRPPSSPSGGPPEPLVLEMLVEVAFDELDDEITLSLFRRARGEPMKPISIAIVAAAETTRLGVTPDMSQIQLHADAALKAVADAGLRTADIDGIAIADET